MPNTSWALVAAIALPALLCVSVPADAQPAPKRMELVREMVLDGNREDFAIVNGGHVNDRGDLALTLRQDAEVRVYDVGGRLVARFGKRGSGPGEFRMAQVQGWLGDTIWVYDFSLRRNSYFTRTGTLIRTQPLDPPELRRPVVNAEGAFIVNLSPNVRRADGTVVGFAQVVRDNRAPNEPETILASIAPNGTVTKLASRVRDRRWEPELIFVNFLTVSQDGMKVLEFGVSDLTVSGSTVNLTRIDANGKLTSTSRLPYRGVPYTKAELDALARRGVGPDRIPAKSPRLPPVRAPVEGVHLRDDGMAFIVMRREGDRTNCVLVDERGVVQGAFDLPARSIMFLVRGNQVWLREYDSDDVPSIVRYRLR